MQKRIIKINSEIRMLVRPARIKNKVFATVHRRGYKSPITGQHFDAKATDAEIVKLAEGYDKVYCIISPDGFDISAVQKVYVGMDEALKALKAWAENYSVQGYYSSVKYGRIPLDHLTDYCDIIPA